MTKLARCLGTSCSWLHLLTTGHQLPPVTTITITISIASCPTSCLQLAPIAAQQRKAIKSRSAHQLGCSAASYQIYFLIENLLQQVSQTWLSVVGKLCYEEICIIGNTLAGWL